MEENNDHSEEILKELKQLNKTLSEELEREKNERDLQATADSDNAEKSAQALKAKEEIEMERFNKISSSLDSLSTKQDSDKKEDEEFRKAVLEAISAVDQDESSETLTEIDTKLGTIVGQYEDTPEVEQRDEVSYFTDLLLVVFFLGFMPAYLAYTGLSKLLDAAMA
ncbi:hypothetical protein ACE40W_22765 [Enterococcus avium]|uniref:hypothetical protein n=1 Tax=Enterococcus avium TaxID=33945 RepID=UPI0035C98BB2